VQPIDRSRFFTSFRMTSRGIFVIATQYLAEVGAEEIGEVERSACGNQLAVVYPQ
jgi:hypothetical protein